MNSIILNQTPSARMTSQEIAELTRKRHDSVKRTIETLADQGVIQFPQIVEVNSGITGPNPKVYVFDLAHKRDSFVVVAQLSPEFTAALVDRWQQLEAQVAAPGRQALPHAAAFKLTPLVVRAARALGLDKNAAAISANNAVLKLTGTDVFDLLGQTHLDAEDQENLYFTPTELGARIGMSGQKFNKALFDAGLQGKNGEHWIPIKDAAAGLYRIFDTGKRHGGGAMIQQIKWSAAVLSRLPVWESIPFPENGARESPV